jgi:hypothetical protein
MPETNASADPLALFAALEHERRGLESRLGEVKKEQAALQAVLLEQWADRGQQSATVNGLTIYVAGDFYCTKRSEKSTAQLIEVLRAEGLERCIEVGYGASSLKAWVKEQLAAGSEIPAAVAECLNFDTIPRLRARVS